MIGRTNTGGGGAAGAIKKGTIVVSYPVGAVCTVSNASGRSYTALDTSGAAAFAVEPGEWTVTITQTGSDPVSKTVTVTEAGWVSVKLEFELYLFDGANGGDVTDLTGGWSVNNTNLAIISDTSLTAKLSNNGSTESRGEFTTVNFIDFANKTRVNVTIDDGSGDYGFVAITDGSSKLAEQTRLAAGTSFLEIPAGLESGKIMVGIGQRMLGANSQSSIFSAVWLT